ncbi:DUF4388 domain-containing protein [Dictyobacter arantiisoli]|uniref:PatA-like N-terminal domain-containing protein n=1 Tax=Dictyobacter arantiisoli TaxID=2014874 RepID=A0A5A5T942_9CHLR|nr:DUF4388 domain-containing protein [Dictyobacter arantiisoli]GCF07922.1 hypothetical protein KDI_14860 [Dictyobacter arantiisoli]
MSLIGTLEQFGLANVLLRLERHEKTGLLIIRQSPQWIEFYIRDGHLLCVGPLRTYASLGDRLVQDGVISLYVWNQVRQTLGNANLGESLIARTLMETGNASRDGLRAWVIHNTVEVLKVLLLWSAGDIYFEEGTPPPAERLLVSMSFSDLLGSAAATTTPAPVAVPPPPAVYSPIEPPIPMVAMQPPLPAQQPPSTPALPQTPVTPRTQPKPSPDVARVPTLMSASQFFDDTPFATPSFATSFPSTGSLSTLPAEEAKVPSSGDATPSFADLAPSFADITPPFADAMPSFADLTPSFADVAPAFSDEAPRQTDSGFVSFLGNMDSVAASSPLSPTPVLNPVPPKRIDTSFMTPDMVLLPKDLSLYREQNPQVQITQDQWCVLTHVDGRTSLMAICQDLGATPDIVCPIVGELIAEDLITPSFPTDDPSPAPVSGDLVASGLSNGYVAPGYASAAASPWSASLPAVPPSADLMTPPAFVGPTDTHGVTTESQWGNGGNGATFIPGRGWITTPQPLQPLAPSGPLDDINGMYAPMSHDY